MEGKDIKEMIENGSNNIDIVGYFPLFHTAMYLKGWYKSKYVAIEKPTYQTIFDIGKDYAFLFQYKQLIESLKITINADGYIANNKIDIANILLSNCIRYISSSDIVFTDILEFSNAIQPSNTWKYNYIHNASLNTNRRPVNVVYDMHMAIIMMCCSKIKMIQNNYINPDTKLNFTVLPRANGITNKSIKEHNLF